MTYESEWDGFAMQACSGVPEALYVAGVDCSVHERGADDPTTVGLDGPDE